jgi:DNA-binding response OmpR family regulator
LNILASANGKVVSKTTISEKLWDYQVITNQNTIEVYINSLRKKIDKNADIKLIHTKVGYGYFLKNEQ